MASASRDVFAPPQIAGRVTSAAYVRPAQAPFEAFFLPVAGGQRFAIHHPAAGTARPQAVVVCVPAFAEEMNKMRRMMALQARAFAAAGIAVLLPDLFGCGDSDGEFADAGWQVWVDDVIQAAEWLCRRYPLAPLWLWGARAGCLLAAQAAHGMASPPHQLWWAPVAQGKLQLQQFLRIRAAAGMLQGQDAALTAPLKAALDRGERVDVAGYRLSPALAGGLAASTLALPPGTRQVLWFEVSNRADAVPSPVAQRHVEQYRGAGATAQATCVTGPAFWQTTEIEEAPALIGVTVQSLLAVA